MPFLTKVILDPFNAFGIVKKYLTVTMTHVSDELPQVNSNTRRSKAVHPYGAVATVLLVADAQSPFTGLYQGVSCGIVRLSLATQPTDTKVLPGLGMKWFIDNQPSANFVAMYSLDGQPSYNFFKNDFSNFIDMPTSKTLGILLRAFKTVSVDPTKVDVTFLAKTVESGLAVSDDNIDAPFQLYLKPNPRLAFADTAHEFRTDLTTIAPNTLLYTVWGRRKTDVKPILIGRIITKSVFIASEFGDQHLFFRHQRIDDQL